MTNLDEKEKDVEKSELDRYKKKIASAFERYKDNIKYAENDICDNAKKLADLFTKEDEENLKLQQEYLIKFQVAQATKRTWQQAVNQLNVSLTYD